MTVRRTGLRVVIIAAVVLIAGIAAAALAMRNLWFGKTGGPVQAVNTPADVVARGKYLSEAADCAACHTAPGGAPFAGGLPMQSGFGTIYATNITPDPDNGIGRWSAEEFWRALHDGVRRDGQQLYPAMPYTSYRGMTRADADAIYAYVMQLRPMKVANRRTELNFPFNIRLGMLGWNLLFLHNSLPAMSDGRFSSMAARPLSGERAGALRRMPYARGIVGEMKLSRSLIGFALGRVAAPDITPAGLASRGWTAAGLRRLPRSRARPSRLGVRRHAPGDHAQHEKSHSGRSQCRCDLSARRQSAAARAAAAARCDRKRRSRKRRWEDELCGAVRGLPRPGRQRRAEHSGGGTQQQHAKACRSAQSDRGDARRHRSAEFSASR